ncbi:MAG: DNA-3-methyladenine glycosylase I [Planctomycetota bacterium]|jgi:DNA-3-methyladenine glycosylase I|nr:DNA-3-methyladenine glycosylase I [Planctomycetota bacterium]
MDKIRCGWCLGNDRYRRYHDEEWGVPLRDDRGQFEFLVLEGAQAGLSWSTILNKREGYRRAFAGFDPEKVACFTEKRVEKLLADPGIVRNRLKIAAAVANARRFIELRDKHGSFSAWIWSFVDGKPIVNRWTSLDQIPASSPESDRLSRELKRLGFKFVGSTIIYAHMQATGMVNDHLVDCHRYREV